ncbi:hypothetical protein [Synechococcus sp. BIOS-E4-1]|uniref:hypothetical protein n=1 Tax=Synechococcus sp. BIOS-E4-1 TaxID=1400864 RepID=UPI0016483569|nr:hypothetical protein [Synechococcus sp. BIOS-E4-1]
MISSQQLSHEITAAGDGGSSHLFIKADLLWIQHLAFYFSQICNYVGDRSVCQILNLDPMSAWSKNYLASVLVARSQALHDSPWQAGMILGDIPSKEEDFVPFRPPVFLLCRRFD